MAIVYQHRRNDTNEVFYIGIGNSKNRAYELDGRNRHWRGIVKKVGYQVDILIEGISWLDACEIEKGLIKDIGRSDLKLGTLVNLTDGGEGLSNYTFSKAAISSISQKLKNRKLSEETKLKISQSTKGTPKPKNSLVGKKKHSEETKQKLRIPKIKVECPHCKKMGGIPVMHRYHFNKCPSLKN